MTIRRSCEVAVDYEMDQKLSLTNNSHFGNITVEIENSNFTSSGKKIVLLYNFFFFCYFTKQVYHKTQ